MHTSQRWRQGEGGKKDNCEVQYDSAAKDLGTQRFAHSLSRDKTKKGDIENKT
jgi:hypothetical protein